MSTILINPFITFPTNVGGATDPDAAAYVAAVEAADGDVLEAGVVTAIDNFVIGCKADGIWAAIKASCIMAGARTLDGALVPLVGSAPTNNNFVSGDYDRTTGLKGDGSTKYLDSNRANNADPQNDKHVAGYISIYTTTNGSLIGNGSWNGGGLGNTSLYLDPTAARLLPRINGDGTGGIYAYTPAPGTFLGLSRTSAAGGSLRVNNTNVIYSYSSQAPSTPSLKVFSDVVVGFINARLSFYSIGESLDLALLDARVSTLMDELMFSVSTGLNPNDYEPETVAYVAAGYRNGGTLS